MDSHEFEHKAGMMERTIVSPIFWFLAIPMGLLIRFAFFREPALDVDVARRASETGATLAIKTALVVLLALILPIAVGIVLGRRRGRNRANGLPPGWKEPVLGSIGIIVTCGNLLSYLFYALSGLIAQRAAWKSGLRRRGAAQAIESVKAERAALEEQFRSAA
jgi:hypothetical protein